MRRQLWLASAIALELGALCGMALLGDLRAHVAAFMALFALAVCTMVAAWSLLPASLRIGQIIGIAIVLRVPMFFTTPSLSDDVWRYLHDGRAQLAGTNPYAYAPADAATVDFRGPEHDRINHPELKTIYPPGAQATFLINALAGSKLFWWRLLLLTAELLIVLALAAIIRQRGLALRNLVLYAWHPLAVVEVIGSAHMEPVGIALMVAGLAAAARGHHVRAGILTGMSAAVKLVAAPLFLVADQLRKPKPLIAGAIIGALLYAAYGPGVNMFESLGVFAVQWEGNASLYALLAALTDGHRARIIAATLLLCVALIIARSRADDIDRSAMFVFALLLLSPVVHPWYLLWLVAFVPVIGAQFDNVRVAALAWSATVVLSYLGGGMTIVEYIPVFLIMAKKWREHTGLVRSLQI